MRISWSIGVLYVSVVGISDARAAVSQRSISLTPSARLAYDSNVLGGRGVVRDNVASQDDWVLSPAVGVEIFYPLGRQSVFLSGSLGYEFYRHNSQLNRERIDLNGGANVQGPAGCAAALKLGYGRRQSDLGDLILAPDGSSLVNVVNVQETRRYSADLSCGRAIGLRPGVGYSRVETRNSSMRRAQDLISDTYSGSLAYTRPSFGSLSVYGSYRDGRYPNRQILTGAVGIGDNIEVYSAGVTYSRNVGSRLSGTVSLGLTKVKPRSPQVPDFSGLSYSAELRFKPSGRLDTRIFASRIAEQSNVLAVSYTITTSYSFGGTYVFSERLSAPFGIGYTKRGFEASPLLPGALTGSSDQTYSASLGLRFRPRQRLTTGLDAAYRKRSSNAGLLDYRSKQVSLSVGLNL